MDVRTMTTDSYISIMFAFLFYRCRLGYFQIVNNYYPTGWGIYAIGGSENPTILSEGNHFVASSAPEVRYWT